ncbi:hypothetical protein ASPZODRAFT_889137 [Penicilliopsis zonata CBS 506.65]|uniref:Uncharacterized protein n=1 Tax=Penicilliopsis zonata CBS 506.65 TaxID=1073090 RepID=A0A1L9S9M9_9EURO|nr:hypothetical protein ASPZODRAFT_889137 [Penicilliopsis zonata CBS 506.65]OJJ43864.1 hypothetical protein ASPZODRAFT_889137 [Penicilliopsis zonata CBS 506.65]
MPSLETLPVEILQTIFLYSLEINLPRASLSIARVLSSPLIYTWLIRLAFSSDNESSRHGIFTPDFLPPPLEFFSLSRSQRRDLQAALLECRWCTLPLMRQCQRDYIEHVLRRKTGDLALSLDPAALQSSLDDGFSRLSDAAHGHRGKGDLVVASRTRADDGSASAERKVAVWFHFGAVQIREPSDVFYERDLFRLPCCNTEFPARLPDKLLRSPWTPTQLEFLDLLAGDAWLDEDPSFPRARQTLRNVVRLRNHAAFTRLLEMHVRTVPYRYSVPWPVHQSTVIAVLKHADTHDDPFVAYLVHKKWNELPDMNSRIKEGLLAKARPAYL